MTRAPLRLDVSFRRCVAAALAGPFARVLLALALGFAANPPSVHADSLPSAPVGTPARQWVEQSYLIAPHRVGQYRWQSTQLDADTPGVGAGFFYQHAEYPDLSADVLIHPAGTANIDAALADGLDEFRTLLQDGQQFGIANEVLEQAPFNLPHPAAQVPGELARLAPAKSIPGHRFLLRQSTENKRQLSASYLFYHSLHLYKVYVRAPEATMRRRDFSCLADEAARSLVPAIEVLNIGTCGSTPQLPVHARHPSSPGAEKEVLSALLAAQLRALHVHGCTNALDTQALQEKSRDAEVIRIDYPPNTWNEQ